MSDLDNKCDFCRYEFNKNYEYKCPVCGTYVESSLKKRFEKGDKVIYKNVVHYVVDYDSYSDECTIKTSSGHTYLVKGSELKNLKNDPDRRPSSFKERKYS